VQSMGFAGVFDARAWDAERAMVVVTTVVPALFKVGFLLGVGLRKEEPKVRTQ
jgi:hypothetical protein